MNLPHFHLLKAYISERYPDYSAHLDAYQNYLVGNSIKAISIADVGFITYKIQGDAAVIYDIYVVPEARGHHASFMLANTVKEKARKAGAVCLIGFSENPHNPLARSGQAAMKAYGFIPVGYDQEDDTLIYLRSVA